MSVKDAREQQVHSEAYRTGELAALEIKRLMVGLEDTLVAISMAPAIEASDMSVCSSYLAKVSRQMPQFAGIAVLDGSGRVRCRQEPGGVGAVLSDRDYIAEALAGRRAVGTYSIGRLSGDYVLPLAVPITDENGKVKGAVAGSLNLGWLKLKLGERNFPPDGNITIADRDGVILARHPEPERFVGTRIPDQYQYLVHAKRSGTLELMSQDGTRRILAYFPPNDPSRDLYVSAGLSTEQEFRAINRASYFSIGVMILTCVATFFAAAFTARRSIQAPVERLLETVEAWRAHDENARTGMAGQDGEFGRLAHAIDAYMDELVAARRQRRRDEERQKLLMGELDHRVKNLLATVQSVARQTFKPAGTDQATIETFGRRLTAIAEAHSLLMRGVEQSAPLDELIEVSIKPFNVATPSRFTVKGPDFTLNSRAALAIGMALHELCTNAVKYGALSSDTGHVEIMWCVEKGEAKPSLRLSWKETGGPPVEKPENSGFGSLMIERILSSQLQGEVEMHFAAEGLSVTLEASIDNAGLQAA